MLKDRIQEYLLFGRLRELDFKKKFEECGFLVEKSTKEQDMREHWDFKIAKDDINLKVDVKGLKDQRDNDLHYIEIKNVLGNVGWAWSKHVDGFVFELKDSWILVEKQPLQNLIKEKTEKVYVNEAKDCLYKLYRRVGRKDVITMVTTSDLIEINKMIIAK